MLITVNNSMSRVTEVTEAQFKKLREALSYSISNQAAYFGGMKYGNKRYLIDKKGNFPTGLLYLVEQTALDWKYDFLECRAMPRSNYNFKFRTPLEPYPDQTKAVARCLSNDRGTVSMPTGTGKSFTMAMLINVLALRTLVVVPNLGLKEQLTATFNSLFENIENIVIENIDSPRLEKLTDFDVLIVDESHHVAAATYQHLNKTAWTKIYHRFFFTATPFRSRDEEQLLMESISGEVIYRLTYKDAVDKGYIVPVEAYYIDLPKQEAKGHTWQQVYKELVTGNKDRNRLIAEILDNMRDREIPAICLVKEIQHGVDIGKEAEYTHAFANGKDERTRQLILEFCLKDRHTLIGTTGVLGEGVDTKPCEYVIIAGLGKSRNLLMQNIGRSVRTYPGKSSAKIIIFRDPSHKFTLRHFRAQAKLLLEEYGVKTIKLEI